MAKLDECRAAASDRAVKAGGADAACAIGELHTWACERGLLCRQPSVDDVAMMAVHRRESLTPHRNAFSTQACQWLRDGSG